MNRSRSNPVLLLAAFLLALGAALPCSGQTGGEDESARIEAALSRALSEIAAEEERARKAQRDHTEALGELGADIARLEKETGDLETRIRKLGSDRAAAAKAVQDLRTREETLAGKVESLVSFLDEGAGLLRSRIELSPPHAGKAERVQRLDTLAAGLQKEGADLPAHLKAYFRALGAQVRLGETSELFSSRVTLDSGEEVDADVLRIGRVFCGYVTKDRLRAGQLFRVSGEKGGYTWKEGEGRDFIENMIRAREAAGRRDALAALPLDVTMDMPPELLGVGKDLLSTLMAGGPVMIPLLLVALTAFLMILERTLYFVRQRPRTGAVRRHVLGALERGDVRSAETFLTRRKGPVVRALHAGFEARGGGKTAMEEALTEAAVVEMGRLERFLTAIGALAVIAPLLGLLGTVTGMIATFDVITIFGTGDPRLLSGGISEALITTQVGLVVAIPILLVHTFLQSRASATVGEIETAGAALVNALLFQSRSGSPAAGEEETLPPPGEEEGGA
jgi:biopolymer transport protein ExbB